MSKKPTTIPMQADETTNDIVCGVVNKYGMTKANALKKLVEVGSKQEKENGFNFEGK